MGAHLIFANAKKFAVEAPVSFLQRSALNGRVLLRSYGKSNKVIQAG